MASSFLLINNTNTSLPLSTSLTIPPGGTRTVTQITLEIARLERLRQITIVRKSPIDEDSKLIPDYIGTVDPNAGTDTGGGTGGTGGSSGSNDLGSLAATDGSVPEFSSASNQWYATTAPRKLVLDGGNF